MNPTSFEQIAEWAGGRVLRGDRSRMATGVSTDTRSLGEGDLFVALRGERFDGHNFVLQAAQAGAVAALVDTRFQPPAGLPDGFGLIEVADTLQGLQSLAQRYRASLPIKIVGITCSSGKTSTKDFTAAVLGSRYRVMKTEGNFNNHIGLPLTLLHATGDDQIGVVELGMNHPGEIAPLAAIAAPNAAIITNIGVAHIEFLKSREAIAREKGMLAEALPTGAPLVMPGRDDFAASIAARSKARAIFTGIEGDFAVRATVLESGLEGSRFRVESATGDSAEVTLPVPGEHMIENALLALAMGECFGVSLADGARGLAESRLTKGRLEQKVIHGVRFLDDSYNANPDSMRAALRTLAGLPVSGRRIAVLGRMGELGSEAEAGHRSVGHAVADARVDLLITVGEEAGWIADAAGERGSGVTVLRVGTPAEAGSVLARHAREGDLVLLKGSRAAQMEGVLPIFEAIRNS